MDSNPGLFCSWVGASVEGEIKSVVFEILRWAEWKCGVWASLGCWASRGPYLVVKVVIHSFTKSICFKLDYIPGTLVVGGMKMGRAGWSLLSWGSWSNKGRQVITNCINNFKR